MSKRLLFIIVLSTVFLNACTHIGPQTIPRDRFDYNTAIADSWKEQTLLNIVKLRYADMPLFVEVTSIVSGYTLESSVNMSGIHSGQTASDIFSIGGSGKFSDRPTITYQPITGSHFNKSFMTPIPPRAILFLMQSGWPVDLIFPLTTRSINGLQSQITAGANQRKGDDEYYRVVSLLRDIQKSGAVGMRLLKNRAGGDSTVIFFHDKNISPDIVAKRREVNRLLGLNPKVSSVKVTYGPIPRDDHEIAMMTNSLLQIMINLATYVDVPQEHIQEGRTPPSRPIRHSDNKDWSLIKIRHSKEIPEESFAAIQYRDHWYWIDDRDFKSKRTFGFLMIIFSLTETGGKEGLPLVTIPAG